MEPRAALSPAAVLFRGLGDVSRLAILRRLVDAERRVTDLVADLGLSQGTVSGHLACLRDCGLVTARPQGRQMFYALAHPQLLELFTATEELLLRIGSTVALCPTYGNPDTGCDDPSCVKSEETA
ncbi:putative transcriptional regulator, ArsR family protein [Nakamurella endophytica]|uniref:Transcriptional regulator, ArsR family protein n=1 Tax=Nakamurella endophytica TaxID=1748367 RepID=A0A917T5Z8_9ACTN|nr:putative transcriptional regulator, ArsR family protein [Nakamurella endophytica]